MNGLRLLLAVDASYSCPHTSHIERNYFDACSPFSSHRFECAIRMSWKCAMAFQRRAHSVYGVARMCYLTLFTRIIHSTDFKREKQKLRISSSRMILCNWIRNAYTMGLVCSLRSDKSTANAHRRHKYHLQKRTCWTYRTHSFLQFVCIEFAIISHRRLYLPNIFIAVRSHHFIELEWAQKIIN